MNLYLVQHGEAKTAEKDPQRSLSDKGRADVEKVAAFVAESTTIKVSRIVHSGKTRAQQTAEIFAQHLNPPNGVTAIEGLEPLADPSICENRIAGETEDIMLVGHLPHLDKLSATLVCRDKAKSVITFQNSGVVCLTADSSGNWRVGWMVTPQMLK